MLTNQQSNKYLIRHINYNEFRKHFERGVTNVPVLSPNHYWQSTRYSVLNTVQSLDSKEVKDIRDFKSIELFICDNILKLDYLLTMAVKKEVFYNNYK
ncbi:MAG: hypothetical protein ACPKPY_09435 [Nitrososphaeraceae archaeon]